jgi:hypothetical protein
MIACLLVDIEQIYFQTTKLQKTIRIFNELLNNKGIIIRNIFNPKNNQIYPL